MKGQLNQEWLSANRFGILHLLIFTGLFYLQNIVSNNTMEQRTLLISY
jgi:hypothetical protein